MIITNAEQSFCRILRDLPSKFKYRYDTEATQALQEALFRSLANNNDDYLKVLFMGNVPGNGDEWALRKAQGAVEGAEYTEAARGKPCGHIFKSGEATYRCKTCTLDDTCVLCSRCFEASDHSGHMVYVSVSPGNSGCCDCGDAEAWKLPVNCAIHSNTHSSAAGKGLEPAGIPDDLIESIRMTIGRAIDYMCDVISCSPEQLRLHKTEESIRADEKASRLSSKWYESKEELEQRPEFALVLWNDEKHTIPEVEEQVARACKAPKSFGLKKANETNDIGRSVVTHSRNLKDLLRIAIIIEHIKVTVTIRSSRDTFREQMCGTMIQWLVDISGCSVGSNHDILKQTICKEMLKLWRTGSEASNASIGKRGIDDNEINESEELFRGYTITGLPRGPEIVTPGVVIDDNDDEDNESEDNDNDGDVGDGDDEPESQRSDHDGEDMMELDIDLANPDPDGDLEMRTTADPEDNLEVSEATYAGYPPPPPPPPITQTAETYHRRTPSDSDSGDTLMSTRTVTKANIEVPKTPSIHTRKSRVRPPWYWMEQQPNQSDLGAIPLSEDLHQRVRLDWMILFDLRLWKQARIDLRDLYISTVVTVPEFKRVLGLRFAGLYTVLAQLYLIADREPDHSIINLSLQMLTTPSITQEIVERGNFLTNLIAILYTFLTTRQVGHAWDVSTSATLAFDAGSVNNRRMYHFFMDLKYLFGSEYVQSKLRSDERYVLQFLDLIRLPQGICPNLRAVGDHVEYETDAWISASLLTREINRLCRQFAESFRWRRNEDPSTISAVMRTIAKATIVNSIGAERTRFDQAEIKDETRFKQISGFVLDKNASGLTAAYKVVDFVVEKEPISFHHALHYTLSWLIDGAKSMSRDQLRSLLSFRAKDLKESISYKMVVPDHEPETYLVALFDYPLRVCAWLAQMKAGMWVRNGLSLRHQMSTYRGVSQRDLAHHRDIFLLQTAVVICDPSRILASIIDRFGMEDWMKGKYVVRLGYEDTQMLDVAEDFIHLMIVILSDRTSLHPLDEEPNPQALAIRRDIAHILCFKPLSFSDLCSRLADKFQDLEEFQDILEEMTNFRAPEGLSDTGTFELKQEYLAEIDPYIAHYTKNQRDEAETAYRTWIAKKSGKPLSEVVFEPKFRAINSGIFEGLGAFTRTALFAQIVYFSLHYTLYAKDLTQNIQHTRVEAFLQVLLHLILSAVIEDRSDENDIAHESCPSFVACALQTDAQANTRSNLTSIFMILQELTNLEDFEACHAKIRIIQLRMQQRRPRLYASITAALGINADRLGTDSPASLEDLEAKKKHAKERQAKVMAQFHQQQQTFLSNQGSIDWGDVDNEDDESIKFGPNGEHRKTWKYPTGNCILCQEETNDSRLFGTFSMMMDSNVIRQTDLQDPDLIGEVIATPSSLDRSADSLRPFGIAGQNRGQIVKLASDGREVMTERQGLGKGFPPSYCVRGPVSTGCGHIMHYACFELYHAATQRRQNHQIARNHPERIQNQEFVCPLCKALGNTFLPIVWRGKEEVYPGVLDVELPFEEWINSNIGVTVSRLHKHAVAEENKPANNRHQDLFVNYTSRAIIPPLANKLSHLTTLGQTVPISPQQPTRHPMPGLFPDDDQYALASPSHPVSTDSFIMDELITIYNRIRDTIKTNRLASRFSYPPKIPGTAEDLTYTDALARSLGFSISSTEIGQRGIESEPGTTLLDKISPLTITHLRVLSETTSSYIAIGGLKNLGNNKSSQEFVETYGRQLLQLFAGHPQIYGADDAPWVKTPAPVPAALAQDSFVLLSDCSIFLAPALNLDIHHLIRLCYLLELVKVVLALYCNRSFPDIWPMTHVPEGKHELDSNTLEAFKGFMTCIRCFGDPYGPPINPYILTAEVSQRLCLAVSTYALPFLRKAAILLHVRYGVDFPSTGLSDIDEPELVRLTKALRLPSLAQMFASIAYPSGGENLTILQSIVSGWVNHWRWMYETHPFKQSAQIGIRPSHPAIFELVGLPKHFDTLTDETMRRKCPTTGKELTEPVLCLFCGDIFCSQASCCHKDGLGGCNQHQKK